MSNLDLTIIEMFHGDTEVLKIMKGDKQKWPYVPYDAKVEWLQGDGVAYIDTLIVDKGQYTILAELEFSYPTTSAQYAFFYGSNSTWATKARTLRTQYAGGTNNQLYAWYGNTEKTINNHNNNILSIEDSPTSLKVNGVSLWGHSATNIDNNYSIYIFARNATGSPNFGNSTNAASSIKYKSFKILNGNTLLRDYIPVRKNGVGYLYDQVNGQLFGNANSTGAFTYGNDV